jgi:ankyrin repeat protein
MNDEQQKFIEYIDSDNTDEVIKALKAGFNPNFDVYGATPLTLAVGINSPIEIIKALLKYNADPNPIVALPVGGIAMEGSEEINAPRPKEHVSALMIASRNNHLPIVKELIKKHADVNARGSNHLGRLWYTPLMEAVSEGHLPVVKELIKKGADVNVQTEDGTTALMIPSMSAKKGIIVALLNAGADQNMRNAAGKTAAEVKTEKFNKELKEYPRNTHRKESSLYQHELGVKAFLKGEDVDAPAASAASVAAAEEEEGKEGGKRTTRHRTRKPKRHAKTRKC